MSQDHNDTYHITPFPTYIKVFLTLIGLTILTVAVSRFDFGWANALIAFGVASIKAYFVVAFFMHLRTDTMLNRAVMASGFICLLLLFAICAIDVATRVPVESTL